MKLNNLPLILSLTCAVALSANAADKSAKKTAHDTSHKYHHHKHHYGMDESQDKSKPMMKENKDYNFATLKGGLVNPTPLGGNSGLDVGNDTYTVGLSVGRKFEDRFAVELEYMFRGKNTSKSSSSSPQPSDNNTEWKVSSNTFMLNAAADLTDCNKFRPYFKAGLGMSANKAYDYVNSVTDNNSSPAVSTSTYYGETTNSFAWQVGAGVNMKTTEMFDTQLQYMYVDRGAVKTKANYTSSNTGDKTDSSARKGWLKEHVVTIGLTTRF